MKLSAKRASIGVASTMVATGLIVGGVVATSDAAAPTTKTVRIMGSGSGGMFMPSTVKIKLGSKIKWINQDSKVHTVTWKSTKYKLPGKTLGPGATFTVTFTKAGTFSYICTKHLGMYGKVVVTK